MIRLIYTLSPRASGVYIRQTTRAHGITIKYLNQEFIIEKLFYYKLLLICVMPGVYIRQTTRAHGITIKYLNQEFIIEKLFYYKLLLICVMPESVSSLLCHYLIPLRLTFCSINRLIPVYFFICSILCT